MKRVVLVILLLCAGAFTASAEEQAVFGPATYSVKERYGVNNVYTGTIPAAEGLYLVKLQLGGQVPERPDFLTFTLNGVQVLREEVYPFSYIACVLPFGKENKFQIVVRDSTPSGFKRPALPPRFVIMTVLPYNGKLPEGAFGLNSWEGMDELTTLLQKITNPGNASLAVASIDLRKDVAARAEAMRKLSDAKDRSALPFITAVYVNLANNADIRGEAALAVGVLGDKASVPVLMNGIMDAEEKARIGAARALSFYKEEDTREPLVKLLERLDSMRRDAVIAAVVNAGWKPVPALMSLAESPDPHVARNAIGILGTTRDPRAADLLLKLLKDPGPRDIKPIISALGDTKDPRAVEPLLALGKDKSRRAGKEVALGEALSKLGDQRAAEVIADLIKKSESRSDRMQLQGSYQRLTGREYNK